MCLSLAHPARGARSSRGAYKGAANACSSSPPVASGPKVSVRTKRARRERAGLTSMAPHPPLPPPFLLLLQLRRHLRRSPHHDACAGGRGEFIWPENLEQNPEAVDLCGRSSHAHSGASPPHFEAHA